MRRSLCALAAAGVLLAMAAAPAAAAPPTHGTGVISLDLTARFCPDFDVHWVEVTPNQQMLAFAPGANGDQLTRFAGPMWSTLTNVTNGKSVSVGGGVMLNFVAHPNLTFDIWTYGAVVVGYRAVLDDGGPGMWLVDGRVHDLVASDGITTLHHYPVLGRVVDLCAALS